MTTIQNFPVFAGNQVLRHDHLNNLVNYLESQSRLTRNKTIGVGIVGGFLTELVGDKLLISEGVGITSLGYLIYSKPLEYAYYKVYDNTREFSSLEQDFQKTGQEFDTLRKGYDTDYLELSKVYEFISGANNTVASGVYELTNVPTGATPLSTLNASSTTNNWSNKVLVAYLNADIKSLKNCTGDNCDDSGATLEFDLRFLLVDKVVADNMLSLEATRKSAPQLASQSAKIASTGGGVLQNNFLLAPAFIDRLIFPEKTLVNFDQLSDVYRIAVVAAMAQVKDKIGESIVNYSSILSHIYSGNTWTQFIIKIDNVINSLSETKGYNIQYYYDFAAHLVDAFNEFREKALEYNAVCYPVEGAFPRHLMLGILAKIGDDMSANPETYTARNTHIMTGSGYFPLPDNHSSERYRHEFIPAPQLQKQTELREEIWTLHYKMFEMLNRFNPDTETPYVKYIPSKTKAYPLSSRNAIPYYFNVFKNYNDSRSLLFRLWSYKKTSNDQFANLDSYQTIGTQTTLANASTPLRARLTDQNFYRFEGHIGKDIQTVITEIKKRRMDYGLDFKIRVANISDKLNSTEVAKLPIELFKDLVVSDPGIEHMAGVPKGGTLVLVFEEFNTQSDEITKEELERIFGVISLMPKFYLERYSGQYRDLFTRDIRLLSDKVNTPGLTWTQLFVFLDSINADFISLGGGTPIEEISDNSLSVSRTASRAPSDQLYSASQEQFRMVAASNKDSLAITRVDAGGLIISSVDEPFVAYFRTGFRIIYNDRPSAESSRKVVADFALDYACCEAAPKPLITGGGTVSYRECAFEIFGSAEINKIVAAEYKKCYAIEITIVEYSIQGTDVPGPSKVVIPFATSLDLQDRITTVCNMLNQSFSFGLHFSLAPDNKVFIKRVLNQKFEFVVNVRVKMSLTGDFVSVPGPYRFFDNLTNGKGSGTYIVRDFFEVDEKSCTTTGSAYNQNDYYDMQTVKPGLTLYAQASDNTGLETA
jgi:hypothetical protein